jgi:phenylpyruvate tautomerase PptA (4-oxalocrotonate tautomerase family)
MPLYTITTQAGVLDGPAKADLVDKLTAFHAEYAGVPGNWVHIVFHEYPTGSGFTAGRPAPTAALTLLIRRFHPVKRWKWDRSCPMSQASDRSLPRRGDRCLPCAGAESIAPHSRECDSLCGAASLRRINRGLTWPMLPIE